MAQAKRLADLVAGIPGRIFGDAAGTWVRGIAIDSRRATPGDLFLALRGQAADGSDFAAEAVGRGAVAVVLPAGTQPPPGVAGLAVPDVRPMVATLAARFHDRPSEALRVIGVTGTNGKTTVAYMLVQILAAVGHGVAFWTTNETDSGQRRFRPALTTPEAHDLQRFLAEARQTGRDSACLEVSSHGIVQHRVDEVRFAAGAVTNVSADHLDFHGTVEAYRAAKRSFLTALPEDAACVFNADDPGAAAAAAGVRARAVACGLSPGALLRGVDPVLTAWGSGCRVRLDSRLAAAGPAFAGAATEPAGHPLLVPLVGLHNLQNALVALALGLAEGVPVHAALRALARFRPPPRRLHAQAVGPYTVIDDVAMNQASYDAVLGSIAALGPPQLVVVAALRGNRGTAVNATIGSTLARWNRMLSFSPLVASLSRSAVARYPTDLQVRPAESEAFVGAARRGGLDCSLHEELEDAVAEAVGRLRPGGTLVLLGTFGMDDGPGLARRLLGGGGGADADRFPLPET